MPDDDYCISPRDLETLLTCSVRYAIGRRTYMPGVVQRIAREHVEVVQSWTLDQWAEDIERAHSLGDPEVDAPGWRAFAAWCRDECARREEDRDE
jgi:hypothetical protein